MLFENITVIGEGGQVLDNYYLLTEGAFITYLGDRAPRKYVGPKYDGAGKVAVPGYFNLHCHAAMTLLRGYGEGYPLDVWLKDWMFPFEALLDGEDVYWGSMLAIAEMIQSGTCSFTDMYTYIDQVARAVDESGIKANISCGTMTEAGGRFVDNTAYRELTTMLEKLPDYSHDRIRLETSIHAEYTTNPELIREVVEFTAEKKLQIHFHLSETIEEHEACKARHGGRTPAELFYDLGVFDLSGVVAHCVAVEAGDIELLAHSKLTVAHCPKSNLKLGSGIAPIARMLEKGVKVGIGTDGAASNNNLDVLEELSYASLIQKGVDRDPRALPFGQLMDMAGPVCARAQGRVDCGALKTGNRADIVIYDFKRPHLTPVHDPVTSLIYSAKAGDVCLNMVDGQVLYREGQFLTIDIEKVMFEVERIKEEKCRILYNSK